MWHSNAGRIYFSDSIAGNIAPGVEHIDTKLLRYAARIANIEEYIESFPMGITQNRPGRAWVESRAEATYPYSQGCIQGTSLYFL